MTLVAQLNRLMRLLGCALIAGFGSAQAAELQVAVAANFIGPMKRLAASFERESGHRLLLSFAATGQLEAQIRNGAPFELLFAADEATPARIERDGFAELGTRFTYAVGALVLWSPDPVRVDAQAEVLKRAAFKHLAIANPKLAPYGAAAVQVMQGLGVMENLRPKIVEASNIAQAQQFVTTGNAELGFLAKSQVFEDGAFAKGSVWEVPAHLHAPIKQDAVLLKPGAQSAAALAFLTYVQTPAAKGVMRSFGYGP